MNDFYIIISNDFTNSYLYTYAPLAKEAVDSVSFHLFSCIKFVHVWVRKNRHDLPSQSFSFHLLPLIPFFRVAH